MSEKPSDKRRRRPRLQRSDVALILEGAGLLLTILALAL
jgi:hypothetical protein